MICDNCSTMKRLFCIIACKEVNDELCKGDAAFASDYYRAEMWQIWMWAIILFAVAVVASCELSAPIPGATGWNVNPELKYRAVQQLKEAK
jgi:hypothetical protein